MIDLNKQEFKEKLLISKENILLFLNEYSIFCHYLGTQLKIGQTIKNPFRTNDTKPSLGLFSIGSNILFYKDLGSGNSGDCFTFIAKEVFKGNLSYREVLEHVIFEFGLESNFIISMDYTHKQFSKEVTIIKDYEEKIKLPLTIKARPFSLYDYSFWRNFGISHATLKKYRVVPISHYAFGDFIITAPPFAYAYIENKDAKITYKIYLPYEKEMRFFTSMDSSIHSGYEQLPEKGELLIITKSLKDVMSIDEVTGKHAIGIFCENILIKPQVVQEYKERFSTVISLFDNDVAGKNTAKLYQDIYNIDPIFLNPKDAKDFSDLVKNKGILFAKKTLDALIYMYFLTTVTNDLPF